MIKLEKIDHQKGIYRFYKLDIQPTLFGEFSFSREWGRIGNKASRRVIKTFECYEDAAQALNCLHVRKMKKGYSIKLYMNISISLSRGFWDKEP
jgi:predicted DNA-binding WGR domain protein